MTLEVRRAASTGEVASAVALLDSVFGSHEGWNATRDQQREAYEAEPGLLVLAFDGDRLVGAAGCDGEGTINHLGVDAEFRNRGIARRLLESTEAILRERGATAAGLGSVDDAVGFYLECGYVPQLLVQFGPETEDPSALVQMLLGGLLSDREVFQTDWNGHPQLWLHEQRVDWDFKRSIEAVAPGAVAQYVMSKSLM